MKKSRKKLIKYSIASLGILLIGYIYGSQKSNEQRIQEGIISYSKELGWINWNHAIPTGTQKAFKRFKKLNEDCDTAFYYTYDLQMGLGCIVTTLYAVQSEKYLVTKIKDKVKLEKVFFEIFRSISTSFEKLQGQFPYNILSLRSSSSFREGDLMGNLISYYLTVNDITIKKFKSNIQHESKTAALKRYSKHRFEREHWSDLKAKILPIFSSILKEDKSDSLDQYSIFVSSKRTYHL